MLMAEVVEVNVGLVVSLISIIAAVACAIGWGFKVYLGIMAEIKKLREELLDKFDQLRIRDERQQAMIDATWLMISDNAKLSAAKNNQWGHMNSPLVINDRARKIYADKGWVQRLQDYYKREGYKLTPIELEMDIQTKFRQELIKDICIPYGMQHGECVVIAAEIAKEAALLPKSSDSSVEETRPTLMAANTAIDGMGDAEIKLATPEMVLERLIQQGINATLDDVKRIMQRRSSKILR